MADDASRPGGGDVKLFLSTVTDEFEPKDESLGIAYRTRVRQLCERPNVSVKIQEDFIATGNTALLKLDDYIQSCDAVIHLVGDMTGARANPAAVRELEQLYSERGIDLGERLPPLKQALPAEACPFSYTQWEAYLAILHRKMLLIAKAGPTAPRGQTLEADDRQRQAQTDHLQRLRELGHYPGFTFVNVDELAANVLKSAILDLLARAHARPVSKPQNIPFASLGPLFKGRSAFLDQVRSKLRAGKVSAIVGAQAVHGMGGLGKTRAAIEYGLSQTQTPLQKSSRAGALAFGDLPVRYKMEPDTNPL